VDTATSRTEHCLAEISAPEGEGTRTFTQVYAEDALRGAAAADGRHRDHSPLSRLDGSVVAVKDLFDVAGQATWAGSVALRHAPAAAADAPVIARLRQAGAVIVGKTNMTEFAYSGLGLNPHFGTPANPFERASTRRIPGGSSSGAAVAITDGMADIALGTDTGGSVRIPAALCGVTGWKPTARRLSLAGVWPLSPTFDSVGVLAPNVASCIDADVILSGEILSIDAPSISGLRLARLRAYVETDLDEQVARSYEATLGRLKDAGALILDVEVPELERIPGEQPGVIMPTYEAFHTHAKLLEPLGHLYDPRVRQRLEMGRQISPERYASAAAIRRELQQAAARALRAYDAFLLPTVAVIAPPIGVFDSDERYLALNRRVLRNTSLLNFLDGSAITLPCHAPGTAPVGLSVAALGVRDARVLTVARAVEAVVVQARL
jgi:aspartyl-tRNA(Asn)/glutamyl-tRNA(Gln) amidotransferase subunit A